MSEDILDRIPENMSDKMLEDMLDRMSEDMSDRMSEDLSILKSINIMKGIIRNIIIIFILYLFNNIEKN